MSEDKVIVFRRFAAYVEAEIMKGVLESNGIQCSIVNEGMSNILPYLNTGNDFICLLINEMDQQKAENVIAAGFDEQELDSFE